MSIVGIIFAVVCALFGAGVDDIRGFFFGALAGYLLGASFEFKRRLNGLSETLKALRAEMHALASTRDIAPSAVHEAPAIPPILPLSKSEPDPEPEPQQPQRAISAQQTRSYTMPSAAPQAQREYSVPPKPAPDAMDIVFAKLTARVKSFFTDGNVVVRIGLIVLFFGVGFLIKYASERNYLPIELRLTGIALAGVAMLALGWRLRSKRRTYALLMQGGAIGVMYLTVFAALKYGTVAPAFALAVMLALVVLSAILAVLQDARPLALFGAAGGFLAPLLTSTGGGSHVMLFSYYALLNVGIVGIAWFRSWRELNLLGFVFTFVIGSVWGAKYYQPAFFATVEPFLILFFVFYMVISVLFATRQPPQLKGYVDGSLVFGVPIVAFSLQAALVHDVKSELAFSALALGVFYALFATGLWKRSGAGLRLLVEAFLALAVVFGTLAIPLALDGRWTAAAWALEGAAMVWIGVRQQRLLARWFGLLVQLFAGVSFLYAFALVPVGAEWPVFNGLFLGCALMSLAGLFSAYYWQRHAQALRAYEAPMAIPVFIWGVLWWLVAGLHEINYFILVPFHWHAWLAFLAASAGLMNALAPRWNWPLLRYPALGLLPVVGVMLLVEWSTQSHPAARYGYLAWPFWGLVQYRLLRSGESAWPGAWLRVSHVLSMWLVMILLTWEVQWLLNDLVQGSRTWGFIAWGTVPAAMAMLIIKWRDAMGWPVAAQRALYVGTGLLPVMVYLWGWLASASITQAGDPYPLPYVPLLSPLDLAQAFVLLVWVKWVLALRALPASPLATLPPSAPYYAIAAGAFLWFNGMIARSVHHWLGVSYTPDTLFNSMTFQAAISIAWTLLALGVMVAANRSGKRAVWFTGAALIAAVVVKLFLVDLSSTGTMARIVSFLAVGGLLMVVGYFSPLPPRRVQAEVAA